MKSLKKVWLAFFLILAVVAVKISDVKVVQGVENLQEAADSISYRTHVQTYGWQDWVSNGGMSGTSGQAKRLEGIEIKSDYREGIRYRTHVQTYGWQDWVSNGEMSGTSGQAKRLEAIQIELTGDMAEKYDIYYRVHAQTFGWMGWAKNGGYAGSAGYAKRLEGIEIRLVEKGADVPGSMEGAYRHPFVEYRTHVQTYGWQDWRRDGAMSGTSGQAKRLEGIQIKLMNQEFGGDIRYRTHVQTYGWQDWVSNGEMSGTSGQAKRLEAIQIELTGDMAAQFDIYYRVHAQTLGWMRWVKNGTQAGTVGKGKRLESIEIQIVPKGGDAPGTTDIVTAPNAYVLDAQTGNVIYDKNGENPIAPASTAKMLTALTVLEYCLPEEVVAVGSELDKVPADSSRAWLQYNDRMTVRQLIEALLLPSGNDAAYTAAVYAGQKISGEQISIDEAVQVFMEAMNTKATEAGAVSSYFVRPDGYDIEGQYTTAKDLALIGKKFLENPILMEISGIYSVRETFENGKNMTFTNTNELINPKSTYYYSPAIGIKTGNSANAGSGLVSAAVINNTTYICVVMGGTPDGRYQDSLNVFYDLETGWGIQ